MSPLTPSVFCWKSPGEGDMELSEADLHTIKVQTVWNVEICDQNWQLFWYEKTWNKLTASTWGRNRGYFFLGTYLGFFFVGNSVEVNVFTITICFFAWKCQAPNEWSPTSLPSLRKTLEEWEHNPKTGDKNDDKNTYMVLLVIGDFSIYRLFTIWPYPSIPTGFRLGEVDVLPNCLGHWHPNLSTWSTLILAEMNYGAQPFKWLKISAPKETHNRNLSPSLVVPSIKVLKKTHFKLNTSFHTNFPKTSRWFVAIFPLTLLGYLVVLQPLGLDWFFRR